MQPSQQQDIHAPAGFEPAIPAKEKLQTHAFDVQLLGSAKLSYISDIILPSYHFVIHLKQFSNPKDGRSV